MATRKTLEERARLASRFSYLMHDRAFRERADKVMPVDSEGEYSIIVMAPDESAVIALHRMGLLGEQRATLVSSIDGELHAFFFTRRHSPASEDRKYDVPGGMTVEDWLKLAKENRGKFSYSANGSEFAADLSSNELASV